MSRDVQEDFRQLLDFVREYSLGDPEDTTARRELLSRQHKKYHALLTILGEIRHQSFAPISPEASNADELNQAFHERLAEFGSDVGSAFFSWIHGGYKGGRLLIRSGIENFVKAVVLIEDSTVLTVKSTYEVFDRAAETSFFRSHKPRLDRLRDLYAILSRDVHTATPAQMALVGALNFFPQFAADEAEEFAGLLERIVCECLEIISLLFPELYHGMHRQNRDIVNAVLDRDTRAILNRDG